MTTAPRGIRPALAVAAAATVAVGVVVVILLFGIRQAPSFTSVADERDERLAGRVAFVREEDDRSCVVVTDLPSAPEHEIVCDEPSAWYGQDLWWAAEDQLAVVLYEAGGPFVVTFDPDTGRELDRAAQTIDDGPDYERAWPTIRASDAGELTTYSDEGSVEVRLTVGDDERTLLDARGPRDYVLWDVSWSPDGAWALVSDSDARVLLVSATAPMTTLLLAENAHSAVWGR